jgi:hypothetical protein
MPDQDLLPEVGNIKQTASGDKPAENGKEEKNETAQYETQNGNIDADMLAHGAAEAAGRARAAASQEDLTDMCLERLVAASGFGRCHVIHVMTKPHHMLYDGPYHMIACSMGVSPVVSSPEAFNMAVVNDNFQDNHTQAKRRKHHHHHSDSQQSANANHHQRPPNFLLREVSMHRKRHLITHYVIQLEAFEGNFRKFGSVESHSSISTTVEAHILGMPKSELRQQRMRIRAPPPPEETDRPQEDEDDDDNDEMESEFSEPREPVTAIG